MKRPNLYLKRNLNFSTKNVSKSHKFVMLKYKLFIYFFTDTKSLSWPVLSSDVVNCFS